MYLVFQRTIGAVIRFRLLSRQRCCRVSAAVRSARRLPAHRGPNTARPSYFTRLNTSTWPFLSPSRSPRSPIGTGVAAAEHNSFSTIWISASSPPGDSASHHSTQSSKDSCLSCRRRTIKTFGSVGGNRQNAHNVRLRSEDPPRANTVEIRNYTCGGVRRRGGAL